MIFVENSSVINAVSWRLLVLFVRSIDLMMGSDWLVLSDQLMLKTEVAKAENGSSLKLSDQR
jgi:hypothetical protein